MIKELQSHTLTVSPAKLLGFSFERPSICSTTRPHGPATCLLWEKNIKKKKQHFLFVLLKSASNEPAVLASSQKSQQRVTTGGTGITPLKSPHSRLVLTSRTFYCVFSILIDWFHLFLNLVRTCDFLSRVCQCGCKTPLCGLMSFHLLCQLHGKPGWSCGLCNLRDSSCFSFLWNPSGWERPGLEEPPSSSYWGFYSGPQWPS